MEAETCLFSVVISAIFFHTYLVTGIPIITVYNTRSSLPIPGGISPSIIESVTSGTLLALDHCQNLFQWDRWNCPKEEFARHSKQPATRETAFAKAIIAAGIVHSITRNCSRGEIRECGCNPKLEGPLPQPTEFYGEDLYSAQNKTLITGNILLNNTNSSEIVKWSWGGCSDDTSFGIRVAKELLDNSEKSLSISAYVGKHNYRVGREIVRQSLIKKCRCHGVSGSCSLQTCWMQVTPFQQVARKLRDKYTKASRLTTENVRASISLRSNAIKRKEKEKNLPAPEHMLVYLEQSPDYCVPNATQNWPGTKGRSCSKSKSDVTTLSEKRSCRNLCRQCGYKVRKEKRTIKKRCNCSFEWCCAVKCDTCVENIAEFYCY